MPLTAAPPASPPAQIQKAKPAAEAEEALLEAFDLGRPLPPFRAGPVKLRWLGAAATFEPSGALPADPFPPGPAHREAAALRALSLKPPSEWAARFATLPLRQPGTALALWRWGQAQRRAGRMDTPTRQAWEDRLLVGGPPMTRGYALRHALCWALAERDESRFATLKTRFARDAEALVGGFQRLFGWFGTTSPVLRLWTLPGLEYQDVRLDQLGATRLWICPVEEGPLPSLPPGTAWIIPSAEGVQDPRSPNLEEGTQREGQALAERLRATGRSAQFAPSRAGLERLGLAWFPILVELDGQGAVQALRMGDAAPKEP